MGNLPTYLLVMSGVYGLSMLVFTIIFFDRWIRLRKLVNKYLGYGLISAGILLIFEVLLLLTEPMLIAGRTIATLIATDLFAMLRLIAFTVMGLHYAKQLKMPLLPMLAPHLDNYQLVTGLPKAEVSNLPHASYALNTGSPVAVQNGLDNSFIQPSFQARAYSKNKNWVLTVFGMTAVIAAFSTLLLYLTGAETSSFLRGLQSQIASNETISIVGILVVLQFAFAEEIIFRLGIQNFLNNLFGRTQTAHWAAIIVSTFIWALGHAGMLSPEWVKFLQIFVAGLGLGWLNKNYGIEACIAVHCLLNLVMYFIGIQLFI